MAGGIKMEPILSAKMTAYITVLEALKRVRVKKGLYPAEFTKAANQEINAIRSRMMASARKVHGREAIAQQCAEAPEFAEKWKNLKLIRSYYSAACRQDKLRSKLIALQSQTQEEQEK